jgi:flagellar motor switch protein FliG
LPELVAFEDLDLLDGGDLRAVFGQVADAQVLDALIGSPAGLRHRLLTKLSPSRASWLEAQINAHGPVTVPAVQSAQCALVEVLRRLSRGGQVAFDDPADVMVA